MDIKAKLKEYGIKVTDLSEAIHITRPTLNSYIHNYEQGNKIPNSKYQFIFDKLFSNENCPKEEFEKNLKHFQRLLERDELMGTIDLDVRKTDLITAVMNSIKADLKEDDYEESIYVFINTMISGYRKEKTFKSLATYFLYLNGIYDFKNIKESEKPFLSNCFKLMYEEKNDLLEINEAYFNQFVERINEIQQIQEKVRKEKLEEAIKKKIKSKMNEKIQSQLKLGIDLEDIDFEEILNNLN